MSHLKCVNGKRSIWFLQTVKERGEHEDKGLGLGKDRIEGCIENGPQVYGLVRLEVGLD